jgi:hypothetical protein
MLYVNRDFANQLLQPFFFFYILVAEDYKMNQ